MPGNNRTPKRSKNPIPSAFKDLKCPEVKVNKPIQRYLNRIFLFRRFSLISLVSPERNSHDGGIP